DDSKKPPDGAQPAEKKKEKAEAASPQSSPKGKGGSEAKPKEKEKSADGETLSPAVRRIVDEENLDPAKISGTGPGGRITKADALAAVQKKPVGDAVSVPSDAKQAASPIEDRQSTDGRFIRKKMSPLRRKIAAQLVMSQHTAAIL